MNASDNNQELLLSVDCLAFGQLLQALLAAAWGWAGGKAGHADLVHSQQNWKLISGATEVNFI